MKTLFLKLLLFLLIGFTILLPLSWAVRNAKEIVLADTIFEFPKRTTTLIIGDSHLETGINPKNISDSYSIAKSGENYFYTYSKLTHFLKHNRGIETIILGCSWHNFANKYQESYLIGDKSSAMHGYFPLLDDEAKSILRRWSPDYIVPLLVYDIGIPIGLYKDKLVLAGLMHKKIRKDDITFFGGYKEVKVSKVNEPSIQGKINLYFGDTNADKSDLMETYIFKIIELCEKNKLNVILVNSPVHPLFRERVPERYITSFNNVLTDISKKYKNVAYIDLSGLGLRGSDYFDADHVNKFGAEIVGRKLADAIGTSLKKGF